VDLEIQQIYVYQSSIFHAKTNKKLWSYFTKVVVLLTGNPTKLGFYFSDVSIIFYEFSKFQPKPFTI
jgi:hypothetical protein